jgi:hypothetical protein
MTGPDPSDVHCGASADRDPAYERLRASYVKIGKSLRVPLAMFTQISAVAEKRRMSWSALVRQWIAEGLARDVEAEVDPVVELHHHLDAATRALRALEGQRLDAA